MLFGKRRKANQATFRPRLKKKWRNYYWDYCLGDLILNAINMLAVAVLIYCGRAILLMGAGDLFQ